MHTVFLHTVCIAYSDLSFSYYVLLKGSSLPPISSERHGKVYNKKTARNEHELSTNIRDENKECAETKSEHNVTAEDEA